MQSPGVLASLKTLVKHHDDLMLRIWCLTYLYACLLMLQLFNFISEMLLGLMHLG